MKDLNEKIIEWAKERGLDEKGTVEGQSIKTAEEMAELIKGISKGDIDLIKDSVGDTYVTLVIGNMLDEDLDLEEHYEEVNRNLETYLEENKKEEIDCLAQSITDVIRNGYDEDTLYYGLANLMAIADIYELDFKDCIRFAYNEIANRKGKMINGTFVKEEDLHD